MKITKPKSILLTLTLSCFVITGLLAIQNPAAAGIISTRYKEYKAKYKNEEDKQDYFKMKTLKKDHSQSFFFWKNLCETHKNDTDAQFAKLTPETQEMCQQYYSYHGYKKYVYYRDKHRDDRNSGNNSNNEEADSFVGGTDTIQDADSNDDGNSDNNSNGNNEEAASFVCGTDTIQDADSNEYDTVLVNDQCWMASNMMTAKYPDGSSITRGPVDASWDGNDNGYYAYPPNATNDAEESLANIISNNLGFVYQWSVAMNGSTTEGAQGICPTGWHIPTDSQQYALENYLKDTEETCDANRVDSGCATAGTKLQSGGTSGMDFPLAGNREADGFLGGRTLDFGFWSSSESGTSAWNRGVDSEMVYRYPNAKAYGFSVRCLKD